MLDGNSRSFDDLPAELIERVLTLCSDLPTSIVVETLLAPYPRPFWVRINSHPRSVRDAIDPLLPPCWSNLSPSHFPVSLKKAWQIVLLKWDDVATIPAYVVAWVAKFVPGLFTYTFVTAAAEAGRLDLLQLIHAFNIRKFCCGTMDAAARAGRLAVLRFLHTQRKEGCTAQAMTEAIRHRHLDAAKFLAAHRTELCGPEALSDAASSGDVEAVRFLQTVVGCEPGELDAGSAPDLATLRVLHEEFGWPITSHTVEVMAARGSADALRYCLERCAACNPEALRAMFYQQGTVEAMAVANEFFPHETGLWSSLVWDFLAGTGALERLEWLYNHRTEGCTEDAMSSAALEGHLDTVKFLRTKGLEPNQSVLFDAIRSGNVELVRYLHTIPSLQGCWDSGLVQVAAMVGQAGVTKYLWEELGLVPDVLEFEPYNAGHLDVTLFAVDKGVTITIPNLCFALIEATNSSSLEKIQRLHELIPNPVPDDLDRIYEAPAELGRLDVIQFLRTNRLEEPSPGALLLAARRGRTQVAQYFIQDMGMVPTVEMVGEAASGDNVETMRLLLEHLPADFVLDEAIESACGNDTVEALRWLHRKGQAAGNLSNLWVPRSLDVMEELINVYGVRLDSSAVKRAAFCWAFDTSRRVLESELGRDLKHPLEDLFAIGNADLTLYALDHDRFEINDDTHVFVDGLDFHACRSYLFDPLSDATRPSLLNLSAAYMASLVFVRLYARHPEQCTTRTAEVAARNGNLRTLRFLSRRAPHVFAESVMTHAVEGQCLVEVVEHLLEHHPMRRDYQGSEKKDGGEVGVGKVRGGPVSY
ncbi:hypothetical protein HDU96_007942 [Phlyctochytrium bullatum]|nr:hypothetical protein HDU96_007942 [Phlyctochytrium bullatum]